MHVFILARPWIKIPPDGYGGAEVVITNIVDSLLEKGHEVTLFATGDSNTKANLVYHYKEALGNIPALKINPLYSLQHIHTAFKYIDEHKSEIDIVHDHFGALAQFYLDRLDIPHISTIHDPLNIDTGYFNQHLDKEKTQVWESSRMVFDRFQDHPFISISNKQREGIPDLNYIDTIYNGIYPDEFKDFGGNGDYFAWIGRITPLKGTDIAINAAKKAQVKLKLAAYVDIIGKDYYEGEIKPILNDNIEVLGEITSQEEKTKFLGNAKALLFPLRWDEAFGVVLIEALASGTPVIAFNKGAVPEIIEDGKTGFIVENEDQMIEAMGKIDAIDRAYCREYVTHKFTVNKMSDKYIEAYKKVLSNTT